ncbi:hypothetical protein M0802_012905 [Mischocyttarus mexicanus]|nr:hypothetical protein M0802_012905 [Mischocyttarus mexicanus]
MSVWGLSVHKGVSVRRYVWESGKSVSTRSLWAGEKEHKNNMKDTEKEVIKGGPRNPPTAMRDSALAGHPSSTSVNRHSSTVGNLAVKMENATASKKCELGKIGAAEEEVLFLGCKTPPGKDARPFGFVFESPGPSQQTSKLKRRIVKPLIVSPFSSASSEKDVRMNENVAPTLDIRMDPDRILMKAMKDITIVEEDRRRSANLKGERMETRQKALEKRNRLLEREVDKLRKEGKNDSSKKKSGSCYKNALPQRGQEDAASRCKITEDIRIPKESVVAKRLEKLSKPPSNNEARIDSLVASVATLATAIAEIHRQVKSLVKPRDSYVILDKFPTWDRTAFSKIGSNWFRLGNQRASKRNAQ